MQGMPDKLSNNQPSNLKKKSNSNSSPTPCPASIDLSSDSNLWLICFSLAIIAILFSQEISDYIYANDEAHILKHQSSLRTPNISAWSVVPMSSRGGGYGVIANRDIHPGELIMKEAPLVRIQTTHSSVDKANRRIYQIIQGLSGEDRSRFLSLSNAWENADNQANLLSKYTGILQTNGISAGVGFTAIFPSIARLNHACVGAVNALSNWRLNERVQVVHVTKRIRAGEEIFLPYFDSKLPREDRQTLLLQAYRFNCTCAVCSLDEHKSKESDSRITRINSLKATLSAWSARSIGGGEAIRLIESAIKLMHEEGMTYEFGQLYADAAHIASAHSDFQSSKRYALLAAQHFTIEIGPDSIEVAVAKKIAKNPTSSNVWATRTQETI
ncbi:hypothetical protein O181_026255 [Austropuccinia psidii MF-1]|uniref:SET domain-containing protein n=1 Tax=Austropuccinia psidii MF-1 TaxID=1389203 RepID=A0A9Q3CP21_9BASI|nr:hypothetical protein [Austropuccinia psidii MF-1]